MALVQRMRRQYAVKWARLGLNQFGQRVYAAPVEIRVRWEGASEINRKSYMIEDTNSEVVYTADYAVLKGDALWQGRLSDLPVEKVTDPFADSDGADSSVWEVAKISRFPSLRNRPKKTLYVAVLGSRSKPAEG